MSDITFVQGDTAPPIKGTILRTEEGTARDLTDATEVRFQMKKPGDRRYTVDAVADITAAAAGRVQYDWEVNDLSVEGEYHGQWQIEWLDGKIQTTQPVNTITVRKQ